MSNSAFKKYQIGGDQTVTSGSTTKTYSGNTITLYWDKVGDIYFNLRMRNTLTTGLGGGSGFAPTMGSLSAMLGSQNATPSQNEIITDSLASFMSNFVLGDLVEKYVQTNIQSGPTGSFSNGWSLKTAYSGRVLFDDVYSSSTGIYYSILTGFKVVTPLVSFEEFTVLVDTDNDASTTTQIWYKKQGNKYFDFTCSGSQVIFDPNSGTTVSNSTVQRLGFLIGVTPVSVDVGSLVNNGKKYNPAGSGSAQLQWSGYGVPREKLNAFYV